VDGERGGHRRVVAGQSRVAVEGLGVGGVQLGPLAGEEVLVDRVPGERVPEGVATAGSVDDEQEGVHRLAQRLVQLGGGHRGDLGQQPLGHPAARDGGGAQEPLGGA
jgi:hypothetical protein